MEELSDMLSGKNILCLEEPRKTDGVGVEDLFSTNRHEPLDASHGAKIMAREVGVSFSIFFYDEFSVALQIKAAIS